MGNLAGMFGGGFRADEVDTSDIIPEGSYKAIISNAELKTAKTSGATYLSLEFSMLSPSVNGRKHWENLNLAHEKESVRAIAKKQLAKICKAVGIGDLTDTSQLCGKKLQVTISVRTDDAGDKRNSVKRVAPWNAAPTQLAAAQTPAMPSAPAGDDDEGFWGDQ